MRSGQWECRQCELCRSWLVRRAMNGSARAIVITFYVSFWLAIFIPHDTWRTPTPNVPVSCRLFTSLNRISLLTFLEVAFLEIHYRALIMNSCWRYKVPRIWRWNVGFCLLDSPSSLFFPVKLGSSQFSMSSWCRHSGEHKRRFLIQRHSHCVHFVFTLCIILSKAFEREHIYVWSIHYKIKLATMTLEDDCHSVSLSSSSSITSASQHSCISSSSLSSHNSDLSRSQRRVTFDFVDIVELSVELGDHPFCRSGPAVQTSGRVKRRISIALQDFETERSSHRRSVPDLYLTSQDRMKLL